MSDLIFDPTPDETPLAEAVIPAPADTDDGDEPEPGDDPGHDPAADGRDVDG